MWLTVIAVLSIIFLLVYRSTKRPPNFPPGPPGYPIAGNVFQIDQVFLNKTFHKWWKEYGNIFSVKFGNEYMVLLCDPEAVKKAFSGNHFLDRPKTFVFQSAVYHKNAGIASSWGSRWADNRRFALRHLRDYGFGKSKTEEFIVAELQEIMDGLKKKDGQEVELSWDFNCAITNVIWNITAGTRLSPDSTKIQQFLKVLQDAFKLFGELGVLDAFPWLRHVLPRKWLRFDELEEFLKMFYKFLKLAGADQTTIKILEASGSAVAFLKEEVDRHRSRFNPAEEDRDLIESYLRRFKEEENNPGYNKELEEFNLLAIIGDLFSAGGETTSTTLRWCFLYLIKYPEIQKKIQMLVDNVTGGNRMPSLSDRTSIPYVDAFIMEAQRNANIVPLGGVPHAASCDTTLCGYSIPKGTQVVVYLTACFQDPAYWGDPEVFRPERFMDEDGKLTKIDAFIPFSIGRRSCPGEHLAKSQLFLIICSLLQQFDFEPATGDPDDVCLEPGSESVVRYPKPYKMKIRSRKQ